MKWSPICFEMQTDVGSIAPQRYMGKDKVGSFHIAVYQGRAETEVVTARTCPVRK